MNQTELPTPDTTQLLLEHHLKALRLPAILRVHDKLLAAMRRAVVARFSTCLAPRRGTIPPVI
jgi:hypothetical protein